MQTKSHVVRDTTSTMNNKTHDTEMNHMYNNITPPKDKSDNTHHKHITHNKYDKDDNNITDILKSTIFDYINNSSTIPKLATKHDYDGIVQDIILACHDKIKSLAQKRGASYNTALYVLATVILHYTLTKALIKSQRKITYDSIELDVVIPDIRVLKQNASQSLIICIAIDDDINKICTKLSAISKIQPRHQNLWLVVTSNDMKCPQFTILSESTKKFQISSQSNCNFTTIFSEIKSFLKHNQNSSNNLSILGM